MYMTCPEVRVCQLSTLLITLSLVKNCPIIHGPSNEQMFSSQRQTFYLIHYYRMYTILPHVSLCPKPIELLSHYFLCTFLQFQNCSDLKLFNTRLTIVVQVNISEYRSEGSINWQSTDHRITFPRCFNGPNQFNYSHLKVNFLQRLAIQRPFKLLSPSFLIEDSVPRRFFSFHQTPHKPTGST